MRLVLNELMEIAFLPSPHNDYSLFLFLFNALNLVHNLFFFFFSSPLNSYTRNTRNTRSTSGTLTAFPLRHRLDVTRSAFFALFRLQLFFFFTFSPSPGRVVLFLLLL